MAKSRFAQLEMVECSRRLFAQFRPVRVRIFDTLIPSLYGVLL